MASTLSKAFEEAIHVVEDKNCPKDTIYVVDPQAAGTLAEHPELAIRLSEGKRVLLSSHFDNGLIEEVRGAIQRLGRIDPQPSNPPSDDKGHVNTKS